VNVVTRDKQKMHCGKLWARFNDEIGIINHRIGYKFVGCNVASDADFSGFVSSNLATEYFI
jgi:hypothetical protein